MATQVKIGENDLHTVNPLLSAEWDFDKNAPLTPEMVTAGSSKKVFWKGKCGHEWASTIASRNNGVGCPICARKKNNVKISETALQKRGSLAITHPPLAEEWHPTKNGQLGVNDIVAGTHKTVWWLGKCGHEWQATVKSRSTGSGCPICSSHKIVKGINDIASTNPSLITEWNYHRNKVSFDSLSAGSSQKVWWKCSLGHEWEAAPKSRLSGDGCPYCSGKRILRGFNDLQTTAPELAQEWHPTLNETVMPYEVSANSHAKVWWTCEKGHIWQASPNHRSKGRGCPFCCTNPLVMPGENDLASNNPQLASEWDYEKNGLLTPDKVTVNSSKMVWWKCELGHEWKTSINHRSNGSGCPKCAQGKQTSFPEQAVFYYVHQSYPEAQNGYTEIFGNHGMELDIYIPSLKIGIEYDGIAYHKSQIQKERERKKYNICQDKGIQLIRIRENIEDYSADSSDYLILISSGLEQGIKELSKLGIDIKDVNVARDRDAIEANYRSTLLNNSLASKYPKIASEWNYKKNHKITPDLFPARSNREVWWVCNRGHEWKAKIDARVRGTGCPYCSNNRILKGYNDLLTVRADLAKEWDYDKNTDLDPSSITPGSGKKAWWKCENGHSWQAEISSRNKGHGCPYCAGNRKVNNRSFMIR